MAEPSDPSGSDQPGDSGAASSTGAPEAASGSSPAEHGEIGAEQVDGTGTVATDSEPRPATASGPEAAPPADGATSGTSAARETTEDGAGDGEAPAGPVAAGTDDPAVGASDGDGHVEGEGDGASGAGRDGDEDLVEDLHDKDDEDDVEDLEDAPAKKGGLLTRQVQIDARTILIITAIFALGVGAYVLGQKQARDATDGVATATTVKGGTPTTAFTLPKDFVPFDDKETGIKLAVPKDWVAYSTQDLDKSYRLLVGVPNAKDNLRVRMNAYSTPVTAENIKDQQAVVDSIFSQEKIQVLAREQPTVNGMPALYYVYKFTDANGEPGYHAHFFVFQGRKMVSLVFEAVPEARFTQLAPTFDQIANSLEVAPGEPPAFLQEATVSGATGPATTTPGATTPSSTPPSSTP